MNYTQGIKRTIMTWILCLILYDLIFLSVISAASNVISIDLGSEWMKIAVISVSIQREIKKFLVKKKMYTDGNKILHALLCRQSSERSSAKQGRFL